MASLYMAEAVFIAFMGIKEAPIEGGLGFVPLIATGLVHRIVMRKFIVPGRNLSLEAAANTDVGEGRFNVDGQPLYRQPALKTEEEERGPMPYRSGSDTATFTPEGLSSEQAIEADGDNTDMDVAP